MRTLLEVVWSGRMQALQMHDSTLQSNSSMLQKELAC